MLKKNTKKNNIVILFCYNVENNLESLITKIIKLKIHHISDLVFIDDCSNDKTNEILKRYKKIIKNLKIIKNSTTQGYGKNYIISFKYVFKNKYTKLVFLHGDGQYPAESVKKIFQKLDDTDLCVGTRMKKKYNKKMPIIRNIANVILTKYLNIIFNSGFSEFFSGLRGFKISMLKKIDLNDLTKDWIIEQEVHFKFILNKFKISEISIPTVYENQISRVPPLKYCFSVLKSGLIYKIRSWKKY